MTVFEFLKEIDTHFPKNTKSWLISNLNGNGFNKVQRSPIQNEYCRFLANKNVTYTYTNEAIKLVKRG